MEALLEDLDLPSSLGGDVDENGEIVAKKPGTDSDGAAMEDTPNKDATMEDAPNNDDTMEGLGNGGKEDVPNSNAAMEDAPNNDVSMEGLGNGGMEDFPNDETAMEGLSNGGIDADDDSHSTNSSTSNGSGCTIPLFPQGLSGVDENQAKIDILLGHIQTAVYQFDLDMGIAEGAHLLASIRNSHGDDEDYDSDEHQAVRGALREALRRNPYPRLRRRGGN